MAAIEAAFLSILDTFPQNTTVSVICSSKCYGGTTRWLEQVWKTRMGRTVYYVDLHSEDGIGLIEEIIELSKATTKSNSAPPPPPPPSKFIIFTEVLTNPLLSVLNPLPLLRLSSLNPDISIIVDNTLTSPLLTRPLSWPHNAVSICVESATKYINGHSDVILGSCSTLSTPLSSSLSRIQNTTGSVPSPFDCYLVLRGMKTMELRMERQSRSADVIARGIAGRRDGTVERVYYPTVSSGMSSLEPDASGLVNASHIGWGGVVSFELNPRYETSSLLAGLNVFKVAESLGAVESLVEVPYEMMGFPSEEKAAEKGVKKNLIRLSVGIESTEDLQNDINQALDALAEKSS